MRDFVGNAATIKYLKDSVAGGHLSHAYLFCGPGNVGKTKAGISFARLILCEGEKPSSCTSCPSCKLFAGGNHPDFHFLDKEAIVVDDIRELTSALELRPYRGKAKVALIPHAENLTTQALNSFLKTLEEPTTQTVIILTTENKKNLLETIVSRSRLVQFGLAPDKHIYELLNSEIGIKRAEAEQIVALSSGRPGFAVSLSVDNELATEMIGITSEFMRVYKSADIYEKMTFADKLSKDKELLAVRLQNMEMAARGELMSGKSMKASESLDLLEKLAKSTMMIKQNANVKLVIEGLLLGSIT